MKKIITKGLEIYTFNQNENDYISLTDIARYKNPEFTADVVKNWLRNRATIEFLGIWEQINNPKFKLVEFDQFRKGAGSNSFVLSPQKWIQKTEAIGLISRSGKGGGTFAHKDIAFEFATWISPEFKLYLIKEFQRLKLEENERLVLGWDAKRMLTKINYKIHTDAIKEKIVLPLKLSAKETSITYANEADVLNKALFGMPAKEWKDKNPTLDGNIRDYANVTQLVVLANIENLNAEFIRAGLSQGERLLRLNESAITQMQSLQSSPTVKKLEDI
ncbi:MAG: KilA-N domain-containing protein [Gammaproteobacteria bacterium]